MDTIFLSGLTAECIIGIWDWERKVKQKVVIDLEMAADIRKAAASDTIDDTLDYKKVSKRLLQFVGESRVPAGRDAHRSHRADRDHRVRRAAASRCGSTSRAPARLARRRHRDRAPARGLPAPRRRRREAVGADGLVAAGSNVGAGGEPAARPRRAAPALRAAAGLAAPMPMPRSVSQGEDFVNLVVGFQTRPAGAGSDRAAARGRGGLRPRTRRAEVGAARDGSRHPAVRRLVCDEPGLALPRPDLLRRPYMLGPAAEIAPEAGASDRAPHARRTVARHAAREAHPMRPVDLGWSPLGARGSMSSAGARSDAAPAVDGEDLPGDVRRFGREEVRGARDVFRRAAALERGLADDLVLQCLRRARLRATARARARSR